MACQVCDHCHSYVNHYEGFVVQQGHSYHKECHKCYVCSDTDLHNAEVFKGVIFCSSCSKRIFQGCYTARRAKTRNSTSRNRRIRRESHSIKTRHNSERTRTLEKRYDRSNDGVIGRARRAASSAVYRYEDKSELSLPPVRDNKIIISAESELERSKIIYDNNVDKGLKASSNYAAMGMTTDVTQELLKQIECPVPEEYKYTLKPQTQKRIHREHNTDKNYCSDLRIAELGVSTEIANMVLRQQSDTPFKIKSETKIKRLHSFNTISAMRQDSRFADCQALDSPYSSVQDDPIGILDRRFKSIIKMPYKFFKRNIMDRSSLISILLSMDDDNIMTLYERLKLLFYEEVFEHRSRGIKRLYPTINKRKVPYRLGWLKLMARLSGMLRSQEAIMSKNSVKRCHHYKQSHSYRCMRKQVMKLAGPSRGQLARFRRNVRKIIFPAVLKKMLTLNFNSKALASQGCGSQNLLNGNDNNV